jgi:hypothetical protein
VISAPPRLPGHHTQDAFAAIRHERTGDTLPLSSARGEEAAAMTELSVQRSSAAPLLRFAAARPAATAAFFFIKALAASFIPATCTEKARARTFDSVATTAPTGRPREPRFAVPVLPRRPARHHHACQRGRENAHQALDARPSPCLAVQGDQLRGRSQHQRKRQRGSQHRAQPEELHQPWYCRRCTPRTPKCGKLNGITRRYFRGKLMRRRLVHRTR